MIRRFHILILFLLLFACKKEQLPISSNGDPELFVNAIIGQQEIELIAGVDGYYSNAKLYSATIPINVGEFAGSFFHYFEPASKPQLEFRLRNHKIGVQENSDLEITLQNMSLDYYSKETKEYYPVQFTSDISDLTDNYLWDFGDGSSSTEENPLHYYPFDEIHKYHVRLSSDCEDTAISSDVFLRPNPCSGIISVNPIDSNGNGFIYKAIVYGVEPIQYQWTLNNGIIANTAEIKYDYPLDSSRIEHLRLTAIDAVGCKVEIAKKHAVGNITSCYSNFSYIPNPIEELVDLEGLGKIEIIYTDELGKVYSSFNGDQPATSNFIIDQIEEFVQTSDGNNTKVLEVRFKCTVFDPSGNSLIIDGGKARVAFPIP
jgi:hypothetical protein